MRINVMKKGEHFVGLSGDRIILENRKGEVRIVCLEWDKDGVRQRNGTAAKSRGSARKTDGGK